MLNNETDNSFSDQESLETVTEDSTNGRSEFGNGRLSIHHELSEEAATWYIVETFFAAVERKMLQLTPAAFDTGEISASLREMEDAQKSPPEVFYEMEHVLRQKVNNWRDLLAERDTKIETFHLRRFCDSLESPLDTKFFAALTRFYRSLPHSAMTQSKFDFAVTRLYSVEESKTSRRVRLERDELEKEVTALFGRWGGEIREPKEALAETAEDVETIEEFTREIEQLKSFEEIVKTNLFDRLRICKRNLGERFYEPAIVVAAIECNVATGNAFADLLTKANKDLSAQLLPEFDFAGVFHDVSPNVVEQTSQILRAVPDIESQGQNEYAKSVTQVLEWLALISHDSELEPESAYEGSDVPQSDITTAIDTLAAPSPDKELVQKYLEGATPESELCRKVINVILRAEAIRQNELSKTENPSDGAHSEVTRLLQEMAFLAKDLQLKIPPADKETQSVLLSALNRLLETRLRLEQAIVESSRRVLENANQKVAPIPRKVKRKPVNRWLMAAAVVVLVFGLGAYFFLSFADPAVANAKDVEILNVKDLSGGDFLNTAHRQSGTLFITAKDSWKNLSIKAQENFLREMLDQTSAKNEALIITDGTGQPIGSASAQGIQTVNDLGSPISQ